MADPVLVTTPEFWFVFEVKKNVRNVISCVGQQTVHSAYICLHLAPFRNNVTSVRVTTLPHRLVLLHEEGY